MLAVLETVVNLVGPLFSAADTLSSFNVVTQCTEDSCPGSFFTAIATAWANIGYLTHADVLKFMGKTDFKYWAIILYIAAAVSGLIGVATNSPMRNYTWFFIGPALYSFLIGTTQDVQGVNWMVAGKPVADMSQVWRNAEVGLQNVPLAKEGAVNIDGPNGPTSQYKVAYPMVFLDGLFSTTSNLLVAWTGIGNEVQGKGSNTNLTKSATEEGPWYLLSTLKWGMLENITANTLRNPDTRDAFVTFLASECGDTFKAQIDDGNYIAATQSRGKSEISSIIRDESYQDFSNALAKTAIPTPRSLARLFTTPNSKASIGEFSPALKDEPLKSGRTHGIVCTDYLWTLIQAFRLEAGQAYYQMIRNTPAGMKEEQIVDTLIYGWDVKPNGAGGDQGQIKRAFLKHLILTYIFRNELLFAPQITSVDQRFAPAEQAKRYSDASIGTYGSKQKFIELYNAAVMMPYIQGILAYFLIIAYPIASMLVILPGHYKGFLTWVSFFAWIKLWDVGFAMVQTIERSVWAMIGNHEHMKSTAAAILGVVKRSGGIGVSKYDPNDPLGKVCSLAVGTLDGDCGGSGTDQSLSQAWRIFDRMLITAASIDLDVSNGWYIYIMSALYLAVPAVTGQLVLGAKAGAAGMVRDAFQAVGADGGAAAKMGAQHMHTAAAVTNQASLGQTAYAKAMRKGTGEDGKGPSLAMQSFGKANQASEQGVDKARDGLTKDFLSNKAGMASRHQGSFDRAVGLGRALGGGVDAAFQNAYTSTGEGGGSNRSDVGKLRDAGGVLANSAAAEASKRLGRRADNLAVDATARGQDLSWQMSGKELHQSANRDYAGKLGAQAEFEAQSAAWEAKNAFASHASAMGGIAGMNTGALAPGPKPQEMTGMTMTGMLDRHSATGQKNEKGWYTTSTTSDVGGAAAYSGETLPSSINAMVDQGIRESGSSSLYSTWHNPSSDQETTEKPGPFDLKTAITYAGGSALNGVKDTAVEFGSARGQNDPWPKGMKQ